MAPKAKHSELEQAQHELTLIKALDDIRDNAPDPTTMFGQMVSLIAEQFGADLCLLALVDRDTGDLEMKSLNDRADVLRRVGPEAIQKAAEYGLRLPGIQIMSDSKFFEEIGAGKSSSDLRFAIVPVVMGTRDRLGVMLMARAGEPFGAVEVTLLEAVESQLDSAVIQGHTYFELRLRNKELETIYRVDKIRDERLPFDDMLNKVLHELREVIEAEMGFIMLYQRVTDKLEMRAYSHDDLFHSGDYFDLIERSARESLNKARLIFHNDLEGELNSIMCIPLILESEILGVFGVVNRYGAGGFNEEDRLLLEAIASQIDTAIFEGLEKRRLREVLGRSIDPAVMERLLATPDTSALLKGERATVSVLYADIRGSTALAEETPPELLVGFINSYLGKMAEVILANAGTLDKFVGDEVMAFFGAPDHDPDHALRAVQVALLMQQAHQTVMDEWEPKGVRRASIGVGIATGELIVGEMGSRQRTNYTVIGRAANLGARICGVAKAGQVVVSQATYDMVRDRVEAEPISGLQMKGVSGDVTVYHVTAIRE